MTLPRSWLMTVINVQRCRERNFGWLDILIEPMADLLAQIYKGDSDVGKNLCITTHTFYSDIWQLRTEYLWFESQALRTKPGPVRAVFITRM